jgi:hypothetical protein
VDAFERVYAHMTLSESGAEFTEHSHWDWFDLNWKFVFRGASDVKGARLEMPGED